MKQFLLKVWYYLKPVLKKAWYYVQHLDAIWSVPLGYILFILTGGLLTYFFGYTTGAYDPAFIQPLFLVATIEIGLSAIAVGGMFFTFRGLYRYIYGHKVQEGDKTTITNQSRQDWKTLTVWQRFTVAFGLYLFYVAVGLILYKALV